MLTEKPWFYYQILWKGFELFISGNVVPVVKLLQKERSSYDEIFLGKTTANIFLYTT